ncbi:MAG: nuclear transport factor 2 family protein [Steroidobacteraceae bacterium]
MKRMLAAVLLCAMAVALALGQTSGDREKAQDAGKGNLVGTFTKIENDWWEADKAKDEKALGRILADDWSYLGPQGTMTKAQELAEVKKRDENIASLTLTDMKVRVYGDVAIVTFREQENSTKNNTDSSGQFLYTDVFVKRQGRWQAVNSQGTPLTHK